MFLVLPVLMVYLLMTLLQMNANELLILGLH